MSIQQLITSDEIQMKISEMAEAIYEDYFQADNTNSNGNTPTLTMVCILKGGFMFCADLARAISKVYYTKNSGASEKEPEHSAAPHIEIEFISVRSYVGQTSALTSEGELCIELDTRNPLENKRVLIVEDIIDTGLSMSLLCDRIQARRPASLRICTLLSKPSRRETPVSIDYCGFTIENKFVVGYGMDYEGKYRELPYVGFIE